MPVSSLSSLFPAATPAPVPAHHQQLATCHAMPPRPSFLSPAACNARHPRRPPPTSCNAAHQPPRNATAARLATMNTTLPRHPPSRHRCLPRNPAARLAMQHRQVAAQHRPPRDTARLSRNTPPPRRLLILGIEKMLWMLGTTTSTSRICALTTSFLLVNGLTQLEDLVKEKQHSNVGAHTFCKS